MLDVTTFSFFFERIEFKMATVLRPELSPKNKYHIDKYRYYKLKHLCLQYPEWKKSYSAFDDTSLPLSMIEHIPTDNLPGDPTVKRALMKLFCSERIKLIERTAIETNPYLYNQRYYRRKILYIFENKIRNTLW